MNTAVRQISLALFLLLTLNPIALPAQDPPPIQTEAPAVPQISDEPKTIDPATLMPEKLAEPVSVSFPDASLREIAEWIQTQHGIPVLLDNAALSSSGILPTEPVSDRLQNEPLYLLLNRLQSLNVAWYFEDHIVHITTAPVAEERMTTESYNVSDLLDSGYRLVSLIETIQNESGGNWEELDGEGGSIQLLGDVLLVRQSQAGHRVIAGLLAALREHGRQTFVWDPPQHVTLRQKLDEAVSVQFIGTPLSTAVRTLAEQSGADIRLATAELRDERISGREPVSLALSDRSLRTVLQLLLAELDLDWMLRDGVLWITTRDAAESHAKTAVYDVRDLCRDNDESIQLSQAILSQTGVTWEEMDGEGGTLTFAKAGTLVVRHNEDALRKVAELLAMYRQALISSKPRPRDDSHEKEILTLYYRVATLTADSLAHWIPQVVEPDSWRNDAQPDAVGEILAILASEPKLLDVSGTTLHAGSAAAGTPATDALVVPQTVLIIRQTRAAHEEISKVIDRIEHGDPPIVSGEISGGLGGGGGFSGEVHDGGAGFGSGFFSQPSHQP